MISEVVEIALVVEQLGQFQQLPKTQVILILTLLGPMRLTIQIHFRSSVLPLASLLFGSLIFTELSYVA